MIKWIHTPAFSSYSSTIEEMHIAVNKIIANESPETVFLVEYQDLYTAGTSALDTEKLTGIYDDIPVYYTNRGGRYTYHGPGQRVIYPLLNLHNRKPDIKLYVQHLQETVIKTLQNFGTNSFASQNNVGIWVTTATGDKKIAAIGVRVKKWVTYHGIAVNINTDLTKFDGITPCGLVNGLVTSCQDLGVNISLATFDSIYKHCFAEIFT